MVIGFTENALIQLYGSYPYPKFTKKSELSTEKLKSIEHAAAITDKDWKMLVKMMLKCKYLYGNHQGNLEVQVQTTYPKLEGFR